MSKPALSTHILDTSLGEPGVGMRVCLFIVKDEEWKLIHAGRTSEDGRYTGFVGAAGLGNEIYKLRFDVGEYYYKKSMKTLYPYVEVVFETRANQHYHIPLLVSPYGYSTYRGT